MYPKSYHQVVIKSEYNPMSRTMRKTNVCVMSSYRTGSFPFAEEVPKTKLKTISTKLSELPHHTIYHTIHILSAYRGARRTLCREYQGA